MDKFESLLSKDHVVFEDTAKEHAAFEESPESSVADEGHDSLRPPFATIGAVVLFCAAFSTFVTLIWKFLPDSFLPFAKTSLIGFSVITLVRLFLSLLLPILFFSVRYKIQDTLIMGRYPGIGAALLSFLIGCPASLILVAIHNLLIRFFVSKGIALALPSFFYSSEDISIESRLLALAAAFLIPILLQELFFRGLLFSVWPHGHAVFPKMLLSGFLFAVFMQNPVDFIPLFLLGVLLAYVRQTTDNFLCPVITQIAMLVTYCLFSSLLPFTDYITSAITNDPDPVSLYTAVAALVMSLLAFLPVLAQLRRISHEAAQIAQYQEKEESNSGMWGQLGWSFALGLILFAANWVLLLGI